MSENKIDLDQILKQADQKMEEAMARLKRSKEGKLTKEDIDYLVSLPDEIYPAQKDRNETK